MDVTAADRFTVEHAAELYGLDGWSNSYVSIARDGHLIMSPGRNPEHGIDVYEVVRELAARGIRTPVLLRFPQVLQAQVEQLCSAFAAAIEEYGYPERYQPVFPIKVNPQRPVIDSLIKSGWNFNLGLEVGSRPELLAAAALPLPPDALVICNGFKDAEYLSSAAVAGRLGKRVVVVIEKPFELDRILEQPHDAVPALGFRIRLQARGSGMWEKSGGFASKFGLTTNQLLRALEQLREARLVQRVMLLHFHIGSQVTEIRKVKNAVLEASRIYAKLRKMGLDIRYLDVGGGLGIDYDGSRTSSDASVNYSVQEYANDVVFGIHEVCEQEQVPPPRIVSESGRMLVAYHAMLVTDVRGVIRGVGADPPSLTGNEPQVVQDLAEVARTMTVKNYREYYHDAIEYRDQAQSLFNLGMLGLDDRAKSESLFGLIAGKTVRYAKTAKFVAEEFIDLESRLHDKYICNFSVFQSLPDHWALDQLFPVMPIHRLDERPTRRAKLVDITCDSDGEVDKFVDFKNLKEALEVHALKPGEMYYLAFLLIGAYQDTMGDLHNLFGRVHEAEVLLDDHGAARIGRVRAGDPAVSTMQCFGYQVEDLVQGVQAILEGKAGRGELEAEQARTLVADYRERLNRYTYLE